jgi:SAM-dependent methyltransferase
MKDCPTMHTGFETPDALAKYARLDRFLAGLKGDVYPVPNSPLHDNISRLMLDRLRASHPLAPGARVLDVGCGQGAALALFRDAGLNATGIALGEDVAVCRRQGFDVREMDFAFLEFADESFDLVWCRHVLEHSIFPLFTLAELFRVLRPGGVLYLEMPAPETASGHEANPNHYSVLGRRMWLELIRRAGFAEIGSVDIRFTAGLGPDTYWAFIQRRPPAPAAATAVNATPAALPAASVADRAAAKERVLVCVLGQLRAHQLTWVNFKDNVLDTLGADLAVCIGTDAGFDPANPYFANARHRWTIPEFADYGDGFEMARHELGGEAEWRALLAVRNQWLGGIRGSTAHPGSGAIQIFFRWFLRHNLLRDGLLDRYDRFIVTRSDFFYVCPHPPIELLDHNALWIPDGEDYGGFTDRHLVVAAEDLAASLGLIDDIVLRPRALAAEMSGRADWNIERYLRFQFEKKGLAPRVRRFPYVMFTVRGKSDSSSWSWGQYDAETGMIVKYKSERDQALKYRNVLNTCEDWNIYLRVQDCLR